LDFTRLMDRPVTTWGSFRRYVLSDYLRKWVTLGVLIGVVSGLGAILFYYAIDRAVWLLLGEIAGYQPPMPRGEGETVVTDAARPWLIPLVTTVGGLLSGVIVFGLAPEAEGHGTDAAIDAFHQKGGQIRPRVPAVKLVASAITIGSGGSAGREGPTAQIAAGFGSWLGHVLDLSPADRRTALAVGVGAGIGAIFKAPLGGAILSAEILYVSDFEIDALIPGFIASVVGYTIFGAWAGWDPVFGEGLGLRFSDPPQLAWYAVLGVVCALVGIAYVKAFYGARNLFAGLPIPRFVKPALGGLLVGLIALQFPEVLSMGYGWLQLAMEGNSSDLALGTIVALAGLKIIATSLTIGSGGSGGVFAPGLFIGGMVGASMWGLLHAHVPAMPDTPAPFVIVGMMALFGGVAKAPIAVILMVAEMTNEFSMVIPAMLATIIVYLLTSKTSIYESQVPTRRDSPAHQGEYVVPLIQLLTVGDAMRTDLVTLAPDTPIREAEAKMTAEKRRGFAVLADGKLAGIFTASDAVRAERQELHTVGEAMTTELQVVAPGDSVHTALMRMGEAHVSRLPVVRPDDGSELLGMIDAADIARALDGQLIRLPEIGARDLPSASEP
jgi:CIC family chloride channel protein